MRIALGVVIVKDEKPPQNTDIKTIAVIVLACLTGISAAFSVVAAVNGFWVEFGVCLALAVVLFTVTCPLAYEGDTYQCLTYYCLSANRSVRTATASRSNTRI